MRKVRIIYWEDSHSGPYIPEPPGIIGRPLDALEPDVRISRDGTGKRVQPNGVNATHSLIASLPLSPENRSVQSSR